MAARKQRSSTNVVPFPARPGTKDLIARRIKLWPEMQIFMLFRGLSRDRQHTLIAALLSVGCPRWSGTALKGTERHSDGP